MPVTKRQRTAVFSSMFVAAAVVLAPVSFQQVASAAPATAQTGTVTRLPVSPWGYQEGFRDGFRSGFRDGQRTCHRWNDGHRQFPVRSLVDPRWDYQNGFKDGYRSGFRSGQRSC
ncbi:hypothetical protein [Streptomyces sp. NPDC059575]|uniref:hypothetical protein n=1 Tax=Streptomyces sp. NPDC059575 TaxID=3346872 RepID=UPI0036A3573D